MKKFQSLSFLATLAIAFGMISWGSALHAQTTPSTTPDRQAQQPSSSPDTTPSQQQPGMPPATQQTPSTQSPNQQTPDQATPESGSRSGSTASGATGTDAQTFSGTIVKQGDKYVLQDESGKTYDIDHQPEVAKFAGKRVRVQGTLDPSGKKIMVK